jgi:hypothetical protein
LSADSDPLDLLSIDLPSATAEDAEGARPPDADLLKQLRVASPCDASWDAMEGDDLVRFCPHCRKNVYNLSGMSRREATAFVRETEGRLCVRFYRRVDGTLLTDNCPVGLRAARRWLLAQIGALASTFGLLGIGLLSLLDPALPRPEHRVPTRHSIEDLPHPLVEIGEVAAPLPAYASWVVRRVPVPGPGMAVDVNARARRLGVLLELSQVGGAGSCIVRNHLPWMTDTQQVQVIVSPPTKGLELTLIQASDRHGRRLEVWGGVSSASGDEHIFNLRCPPGVTTVDLTFAIHRVGS